MAIGNILLWKRINWNNQDLSLARTYTECHQNRLSNCRRSLSGVPWYTSTLAMLRSLGMASEDVLDGVQKEGYMCQLRNEQAIPVLAF